MNGKNAENQDSYKSLLLLDEISKGESLSQRDLSKRLNIALGLVNSYLKNLVSKGYVTISQIPAKRYAYYLTPTGFAEKTRLTYHLLQDYTSIYRNARRDFRKLFVDLQKQGIGEVSFAGVDEVTEIAYLSLQEADIELRRVYDDDKRGKVFFKTAVTPLIDLADTDGNIIILTTYLKRATVYKMLLDHGIAQERIFSIYPLESMIGEKAVPPSIT
ncbi:MAG: winged helix-turn-helix transcriptional regulator [Nitrospirae bacterium]|nr:winged helix-turn-helix transcriptional regulator [Nitrospirota bacterium]